MNSNLKRIFKKTFFPEHLWKIPPELRQLGTDFKITQLEISMQMILQEKGSITYFVCKKNTFMMILAAASEPKYIHHCSFNVGKFTEYNIL